MNSERVHLGAVTTYFRAIHVGVTIRYLQFVGNDLQNLLVDVRQEVYKKCGYIRMVHPPTILNK